jgi:anti-sigma factor RsiW
VSWGCAGQRLTSRPEAAAVAPLAERSAFPLLAGGSIFSALVGFAAFSTFTFSAFFFLAGASSSWVWFERDGGEATASERI